MNKFKINFFYLTEEKKHKQSNTIYKEEIFYDYELILTSLKDIKNFFSSDFYNNVCNNIGYIGDGVVVTEDKEVIYKEINDGIFDNKFLIYKNSDGEIFYMEQVGGDIEDKDLVVVDKYNMVGHGYCFEEVDIKEEAIRWEDLK